jgi:hypothetical protein
MGTTMAAVDADHQLLDAAEKGDLALVQSLLEKGADVNAKNGSGATALMLAAGQGHQNVVRLLLDKGADVNAKDGQDTSALMEASKQGLLEIAKLLLGKGSNASATDNKGKTAAMYAEERGHSKVASYVRAYRAAPIVNSAPPKTPELGQASPAGTTDLNLLDTWELLYQVDEKGTEQRPREGTRTLIEFTDKGHVIFNRVINDGSHRMNSRAGKYALDGNKIRITDDVGNTVIWPYGISGDELVIEMPETKKKYYWRRFR